MNLLTWSNEKASTYLRVVKIVLKDEEQNVIKFLGEIYSTSGFLLERKNYSMPLDKYKELQRYEGGFSNGVN